MAESVLYHRLSQANALDEFEVDSAAVSRDELGHPVYPGTCSVLAQHNIPVREHYSRQITAEEYDHWDYIVLMDAKNAQRIRSIIPHDPDKKISMMMSWAGKDRDVKDPWYTGDFESCYDDISEALTGLMQELGVESDETSGN